MAFELIYGLNLIQLGNSTKNSQDLFLLTYIIPQYFFQVILFIYKSYKEGLNFN
jgi:hypothetical protein